MNGSRALLCALALLGGALACGGGDGGEQVDSLRTVMYDIQAECNLIEPRRGNPAVYPELAESARLMLAWTDYTSFVNYPNSPTFTADGELFEEMRQQLRAGLEDLIAATEAGNVDATHAAWATVQQTCTRCHKRFDATY